MHNNELMALNLIELAQAADQLRNRSSIYALKRLCAIRRAQGQRIMEQQEDIGYGKQQKNAS